MAVMMWSCPFHLQHSLPQTTAKRPENSGLE
ncbi:uncharacterized protein G2W53_019821 [Senna tora]|uniref:Uncharacterized protein n=1 Tax=Senna tora TaxID=362788 RepID=A0A834TWR7_9FABA|nr:uncharacterized protein G2W53_019821 [Senna tora]